MLGVLGACLNEALAAGAREGGRGGESDTSDGWEEGVLGLLRVMVQGIMDADSRDRTTLEGALNLMGE